MMHDSEELSDIHVNQSSLLEFVRRKHPRRLYDKMRNYPDVKVVDMLAKYGAKNDPFSLWLLRNLGQNVNSYQVTLCPSRWDRTQLFQVSEPA